MGHTLKEGRKIRGEPTEKRASASRSMRKETGNEKD